MRLVVASACWVAGVYLGLQLDAPASALALFLLASVTLVPLFAIRRWSVLLPVALALLLLGALRSELPLPPGEGLKPYYGLDDVVVEGIVAEGPEVRAARCAFASRLIPWHPAIGGKRCGAISWSPSHHRHS